MNDLGNKIKEVFMGAAVFKNPANNDVFIGRNLPSFVKDYLIATNTNADGSLKREALINFLNEHIPINFNSVRARLLQGEEITLLTRSVFQYCTEQASVSNTGNGNQA